MINPVDALKKIKRTIFFWKKNKLSKLKRYIVGDAVSGLLIKSINGYQFLIEPEDLVIGEHLIKTHGYGMDEIQRISKFISLDSNILVVGAHIGTLAIPLSKKLCSVTAVEANPVTFNLLKNNILLNECKNITPIQVAASDKSGIIDFVLSKTNTGGSKRLPKIKDYIYFYDNPNVISVKTEPLDNLLNEKFDVVLMDIEGSEYFALKGMQNLLTKTTHLVVEFLPHHIRDVAGITVKEFISVIEPHFNILTIPSKNKTYKKDVFVEILVSMYASNQSDSGLIFSKF
jgi:FkbM family methyltransferase